MSKPTEPEGKSEKKKLHIAQRDKIPYDFTLREFPWTEKQKEVISAIGSKESRITMLKGVAGTAKTLLAVYSALDSLSKKKIGEIFYIRNPVESSSFSLGYLKGDLDEKLDPYIQPLKDKMDELVAPSMITKMVEEKRIIGTPLGFLRGRSFNACHVIVDEAQNLTVSDLLLVMTRMGKFAKLTICGDATQSDIKHSGFEEVYDLFNDSEAELRGIKNFEFGKEDIFRSEILSFVIERFEEKKKAESS